MGWFSALYEVHIKCAHCGTENVVTADVAKKGGCSNCKLPLNWSTPKGAHVPNFISVKDRLQYFLIAAVLICASAYALIERSLYVPYGSRNGSGGIAHFTGYGLVLPFLAMLCGIAVVVSVLADHFDVRPNEKTYAEFQRRVSLLGVALYFIAAFFADNALWRLLFQ